MRSDENYHDASLDPPRTSNCLDRSRTINLDSLLCLSTGCAKFLDFLDDIHTLDNLTENNMLIIEPAGDDLSSVVFLK